MYNSPIKRNEIIFYPIHTASSYEPIDKLNADEITYDKLDQWIGKAILYQEKGHGIDIQILNYDTLNNFYFLVTLSGMRGMSLTNFEWVGLASLKTSKRKHVSELQPYNALVNVESTLTKIETKENLLFLTVTAFSKHKPLVLKLNSTRALYYLHDIYKKLSFENGKLPNELKIESEQFETLDKVLNKVAVQENVVIKIGESILIKTPEIYAIAGKAIVTDIQFGHVKLGRFLDESDDFDFDTTLDIIEKDDLSSVEIRIEVSDASWIEHLKLPKSAVYFYHREMPVCEWNKPPLRRSDID